MRAISAKAWVGTYGMVSSTLDPSPNLLFGTSFYLAWLMWHPEPWDWGRERQEVGIWSACILGGGSWSLVNLQSAWVRWRR
jgi:hypothetical protein